MLGWEHRDPTELREPTLLPTEKPYPWVTFPSWGSVSSLTPIDDPFTPSIRSQRSNLGSRDLY